MDGAKPRKPKEIRNREKTNKTSRSPKPAKPRKLEISGIEKFSQKAGTNLKYVVEYKIEHQMKQNKTKYDKKLGDEYHDCTSLPHPF